jgi:hypothetical protein
MVDVQLPIHESMSTADAYPQLELLLDQLDEEERLLSAERRRLQDRIDYFAGEDSAEAAELERKEQDLSRRRRQLHERIDALRGDLGGLD